jgi:hypothetical protein
MIQKLEEELGLRVAMGCGDFWEVEDEVEYYLTNVGLFACTLAMYCTAPKLLSARVIISHFCHVPSPTLCSSNHLIMYAFRNARCEPKSHHCQAQKYTLDPSQHTGSMLDKCS